MCLGFVAAVSALCVLLRLLRLLLGAALWAKTRRRRRRRLPRLCLAAAHFERCAEPLRGLWERCRRAPAAAAPTALRELSKASAELCFESLAWHLAKALKFFEASEVSRGLADATRHLGPVESEDFAVSRSKAFLGAFDVLLEFGLISEAEQIDFDPWFEVQRYGYAAAILGLQAPSPQAVTLSPLEAPRRAAEAFAEALEEESEEKRVEKRGLREEEREKREEEGRRR